VACDDQSRQFTAKAFVYCERQKGLLARFNVMYTRDPETHFLETGFDGGTEWLKFGESVKVGVEDYNIRLTATI
jgi:hypothetical protein